MFANILAKAMLSSNVVAKTTSTFIHKNADKILLAAGIGLITGGTVSAVVKSKDITDVMERHQAKLKKANKIEDDKERGHQKLVVYKDTVIQTMLTFGPCVLLTGTGILCILGSHHILTQRLASCQAAYAMLDTSFREYRERVRAAVGEEKEIELYNNVVETEVVEKNEKGKDVVTTIKDEKGPHGPYDFKFCEIPKDGSYRRGMGNPNWLPISERNRDFLYQRQWQCQDMLNRQGEISLADVLWAIDQFEDRRAIPAYCYDVVWTRGSIVSFGLENDPKFLKGEKPDIWLHFNPDGFRRKMRKEDLAYLKASREIVNKELYSE